MLDNGVFLGFDFGNKKIGIASGNLETKTTSPLQTICSIQQKPNWLRLQQIIEQWQPQGLIVGIATQLDGKDNKITPKIRKFCRQLSGRFHLPVVQIDETLSTFEAKQLLYDLGIKASKLWQVQDQLSAQLILQTWLNEQPNYHD